MKEEPVQATREVLPSRSFALTVGLLAFANFVVVTTEFVVVGLLPATARDLSISLGNAGLFVTSFALSAALLGPLLTMMASRREPRQVLTAAALVFAAGNLLVALAPHYVVVIAVRIVQGGALPVFLGVATVVVARMAGAGREGWAVSLVNIGVVAVSIIGIPAGTLLADKVGWAASFAALGSPGLVSAGFIVLQFPQTLKLIPPSRRSEASLLRQPEFLAHLSLSGLMLTAMFAGYTYIAALLSAVAGLNGTMLAWALMGFGVAGVLGNWIAGRIVDRDPLMATAYAASALAFVMAAVAPAGGMPPMLALVVGVWGAAHTAAFVCNQVRVMTAGCQAPAFAMSLYISIANLGIALGAIIGGQIVARYGVAAVGYGSAIITTTVLLIAIVMAAIRHRRSSTLRSCERQA